MNDRIISDITDFIFVSDEVKKSDVIFLPGGSYPQLPEKAAKLYHDGLASVLMPSGRYSVKVGKFAKVKARGDIYSGDYQTECEFFTDVLIKGGVPECAIIGEDKATYTPENAFFTRRLADERGLCIKSAVIVCKSFHARRCLMLYQIAFPEAAITVCPVDTHEITRDNWFMSEYGTDRVLGELSRCGGQFAGDIKKYLKI